MKFEPVFAVVVLGILIASSIPADASADSSSIQDPADTPYSSGFFIDADDFRARASEGKPILIDIDGLVISFGLAPNMLTDEGAVAFGTDGMVDHSASEHIMEIQTFKGASNEDYLTDISATFSEDYLSISFTINNVSCWIESDAMFGGKWHCEFVSEKTIGGVITDFEQDESHDGINVSRGDAIEADPFVALTNSSSSGIDGFSSQSSIADCRIKNESGPGNDPEYRLCRIILAADYEYYNEYGSQWQARALARLNGVAGNYQSQVGITFSVVAYVQVPTSAIPTSMTDCGDVLDAFGNYMEDYQGGTIRDVSHLCSGKTFDNGYIGGSYEQGVGTNRWSSVPNLAYSISMQDMGNDAKEMWVMGHELGHDFNGNEAWAGSWSWMTPTWSSGIPMTFDTNNRNRISNWGNQVLDLSSVENPGPSSVSSQNLQSSALYFRDNNGGYFYHPPGTSCTVSYRLKNVGTNSITLNYIFIGARDASGANKDFGYVFNVVIAAGSTYSYSVSWSPLSGGAWTMWPAYNYNGAWGPYQWITVQPTMYYLKASNICYEKNTRNNVCYFYKDYLLSQVQTPVVGSSIWTYFTLYNGNAGTSTNTFDFFFVLCRWTGHTKDFGVTGALTLTQQPTGTSCPPGGGYTVFANRVLDSSGTWSFWPCYKLTQGGTVYWGPMIYGLTLTV